jgi:GNAT superfamily N-acetyltransferase
MNQDDILYLSDLNLADFTRERARWNASNEIIEHDDLLMTRSASPSPMTNVAILLNRGARPTGDAVLNRIRSFYAQYQSSYSIHIRTHVDADLELACQKEELYRISDSPGMMIDAVIPEKPLPEDFEIRPVESASAAADFGSVVVQSYQRLGMPAEIGAEIFRSFRRSIVPYNYSLVGYFKGTPVSCAMAFFGHLVAGIYWVGTIQEARGRGMAEACTRRVTNEALRRGAAFAVLQASKFGEPIYKRMGFREITKYPWYMYIHKA